MYTQKAANLDSLVVTGLATLARPVAFGAGGAAAFLTSIATITGFVGITCEIGGTRYYEYYSVTSQTVTSATVPTDPVAAPTTNGAVFTFDTVSKFAANIVDIGTAYYAGEVVTLQISCDTTTPTAVLSSITVNAIPNTLEINSAKIRITKDLTVTTTPLTMLALLQQATTARSCTTYVNHYTTGTPTKESLAITVPIVPYIQMMTYDKTNFKIQLTSTATKPTCVGNFRYTFGTTPKIVHLQEFSAIDPLTRGFDIANF